MDFNTELRKMPLFHPESLAASIVRKRPELVRGHRKIRCVPENPVEFYVLYENPSDYRGKFVLRRWLNQTPDAQPVIVTTNLIEAMAKLPKNVRCLGRKPGEDPAIKDVWTRV